MAADGSVVIEILGDADDITNKLKGVASGAVNGLKTAFAAVTASVTAASAAVGVFAKQALDAYGDYEQLTGGVETLFKDSADIVMGYANNAYQTAGLSANQYMETVTSFSASLIQSLGGDTEKAAKLSDVAITDMADNANKMGTSIESLQYAYRGFSRGNFTMLDNLALGYGGTKEEMERLLADAEKLPSAMGRKFDLSNYADIIEAIHLVQENMDITGTTAKEAASTIQGSVSSAKAAWANLVTGIADENADLETLIDNFIKSAGTAAENILPRITQILTGMGQAIQQMAPILSEQIPALISGVLPDLISAGAQLLTGLIAGIISALPSLAATIPDIISSVVSAIQESLPAISAAGAELLDMLAAGIIEAVPQLVEQLPQVLDGIVNFITETLPDIMDKGIEVLVALADGIIEAVPQLVERLPKIITAFVQFIAKHLPTIVQKGLEIILALGEGIVGAIPELVAQLPQIITAIVNGLKAGIGKIAEVGKDLIRGLWNGISDMASWIGEKIQGFGEGVLDSLKDFFGIKSPSRVMRDEVGKMIGEGVAKGITDSTPDAVNSAKDFTDDLTNALTMDALKGLDIGSVTDQLRAAVEAETGRISANLTISANAPAEARAARDRTNAYQNAAANARVGGNSGDLIVTVPVNGVELARATLPDYRKADRENPETLDDE